MLIFSYGTLVDPDVRERVLGRPVPARPAVARGFSRMLAGDYLTIVPSDRDAAGVVFEAEDGDVARLDVWEEVPAYVLVAVEAEVDGRAVHARTYVMTDPPDMRPAEDGVLSALPKERVLEEADRLMRAAGLRPPPGISRRRGRRSPCWPWPRPRTPGGSW